MRLIWIEFFVIGFECVFVMDIDFVVFFGYVIVFNGECDIDFEVIGGEDVDSCWGE